jgi:TRAP-type C4-dicarboxylate transport system substrate-binding protein
MADANNTSAEIDNFVDAVKAASAGAIEITVTHGWRQGEPNYEVDLIKDVADGKADLGVAGARAFDSIGIRDFQPLVAPFLIDSYDLQRRVLESDTATTMLPGLRQAGLEGLGYLVGPLRRPIGFTRSLASPSDFDGAMIGIRTSRVAEMTFAALGATAVVFPRGDNTGLDGMEGDFGSAREYFDRGVDSLVGNVVLWPRMDVLFADAGSFNTLTEQHRAVLTDAARAAFDMSDSSIRGMGVEQQGILCTIGLNVELATDAHRSELVDAVAPVYAELERDAQTKDAIAAIRDMRDDAAGTEVVPRCPTGEPTPGASAEPTPIDGVWTTSFTLDKFLNSPLLMPGEPSGQNWGDFEMILANGRITFSQANDQDPHYKTSGVFSVSGRDVTFRFLSGGMVGETFTFTFSLYQNTLTFKRHPSVPVSPTPIVLQAWTKSG